MKKTIKILIVTFILLILMNTFSYAKWDPIHGFTGGTNTYMDTDIQIGTTSAINVNKDMTEKMLGIVQVIGSIVSVMALVIIGFRYMFSSVEEKAQLKGVLIYYVIGATLVFATSNLLSVVYNVISGLVF